MAKFQGPDPFQRPAGIPLIALLLFVATCVGLGFSARDQGITRDESTYFDAARNYWGWFDTFGENISRGRLRASFTPRTINRYWEENHEHPALMKELFGLSWRYLRQCPDAHAADCKGSLQLLPEVDALRFPAWLIAALGVVLIFLLGCEVEGRVAGLAAALLYITIPRLFFHAQLSAFDSPIATMTALVVFAYLRSLRSVTWSLLCGVCLGLALATKHNAWFLPPVLLLHYLVVVAPDVSLRPLNLPRIPLAMVSMATLGPLVFALHWPWIWIDTIRRLSEYIGFHLHHVNYNFEYLGQNYNHPPFPVGYPFVMMLFTVPTVLLCLAAAGSWVYARFSILTLISRFTGQPPPPLDDPFRYPARRSWLRPGDGLSPRPGVLFALCALFPLVLIALPSTPKFGGTKHFLTAYPFVALLAGVAVSRIYQGLRLRGRMAKCAGFLLPFVLALPGAVNIVQTHPFGLSQYNALAGGPAGGADLGLQRQYWGYPTRQILPWLNTHIQPDHGRVYFHDTSFASVEYYKRAGLLRPDIQWGGMERDAIFTSDAAMVIHERHFNRYDYWIWDAYGTPSPSMVLSLDNVPVLSAYQRPRAP